MENCCNSAYYECGAWLGCFNSLAVRIPDTYTNEEITIRFGKSFGRVLSARIGATVVAGWVLIDLDGLPEAFINTYAGPYSVEFLNNNGAVFPFIAKNGKPYTKAFFDTMNSATVDEVAQLNFIDNQVY